MACRASGPCQKPLQRNETRWKYTLITTTAREQVMRLKYTNISDQRGVQLHQIRFSCVQLVRNCWDTPFPSGSDTGRCGSGGRAVVWQSEGCRFDSTLGVSKCPWARHLTPNRSWRAGWYLAWQPIAVGVWMCVWTGEWEAKIVKRFG